MNAKKTLVPDVHAWLIKYIVRYFRDIVIDKHNRTLWDELNAFYLSKNNECEYQYENDEQVYLYPILEFNLKRNRVQLMGFKSVSNSVYHLLCDDFLTSEIIKPVETAVHTAPVDVPVQEQAPKQKPGFFQRLLAKKEAPVVEETVNENTLTSQLLPVAPEFDDIDGSNNDYLQFVTGVNLSDFERSLPLDQAIKLLSELNDIDPFDAKSLLMTSSYKRKFAKEQFINLLDNQKILDQKTYRLRFDVTYLFSSGFLGLESLQLYRDSIPSNQLIEMEFDLNLSY